MKVLNRFFLFLNKHLDKVCHLALGYMITTLLPISPYYGFGLALLAGCIKEYRDFRIGKCRPDPWDMVFTVIGGVLGVIAISIK